MCVGGGGVEESGNRVRSARTNLRFRHGSDTNINTYPEGHIYKCTVPFKKSNT